MSEQSELRRLSLKIERLESKCERLQKKLNMADEDADRFAKNNGNFWRTPNEFNLFFCVFCKCSDPSKHAENCPIILHNIRVEGGEG